MNNKGNNIVIILLFLVLVICNTIPFFLYYTFLYKDTKFKIPESYVCPLDPNNFKDGEDIKSFVFLGIDKTETNEGRSDTIIIFTIDNINKSIKIASIMRDTYVSIENHGMTKINHAYAYGGTSLILKTINNNFSLCLNKFVSVDFTGFIKIIDKIGGVEIEIKEYEIPALLNQGISKSGVYNLTGKQALAYSRIRHQGNGDYERTERQREVLEKAIKKLISMGDKAYPLIIELLPYLKTNLDNIELLSFSFIFEKLNDYKIEKDRFPKDEYCDGKLINGIYYITTDLVKTKEQLHEFIYGN